MSKSKLLIALLVLAPPFAGLGIYLWAGQHRIAPGLRGCTMIRDTAKQVGCVSDMMQARVKDDGVEAALESFDRQVHRGAVRAGICHLAAHGVGAPAGERAGRKRAEFPALEHDGFCSQGYDHGYYIAYLDHVKPSSAAPTLVRRCSALASNKATLSCIHSFGHSLGREKGLSDSAAQDLCQNITPVGTSAIVERLRFECSYGVYMEYSLHDLAKGGGALNNCTHVERATAPACYTFLPARMLQMGTSSKDVAAACEKAGDKRSRQLCAQSYGAEATQANACDDIADSLREPCEMGREENPE